MALPAAVLVSGVVGIGSTRAFASGAADQRVAQVLITFHCNDPTFKFCQPVPAGVGVGGALTTAALNTDGSFDANVTMNSHQTPGRPNGALTFVHTTGIWSEVPSAPVCFCFPFYPLTYTGPFYVIAFTEGDLAGLVDVVPVVQGHYSANLVPGVFFQTQIAP
jgi:hypothetical protein